MDDRKDIDNAKNSLMKLGEIYNQFMSVERVPRYSNGRRENDGGHSFHLALSAVEIAANYYPELDIGLVSQFSLVHDLPEVYTGDVATMNIDSDGRAKKEAAEKLALKRLADELPRYTADLLVRYEKQLEPEARFVRYVDKIMPGIVNVINKDVATFLEDNKVYGLEEFDNTISRNQKRFKEMFPDYPFLSELMDSVEDDMRRTFFKIN